jgi:hypothetical protein
MYRKWPNCFPRGCLEPSLFRPCAFTAAPGFQCGTNALKRKSLTPLRCVCEVGSCEKLWLKPKISLPQPLKRRGFRRTEVQMVSRPGGSAASGAAVVQSKMSPPRAQRSQRKAEVQSRDRGGAEPDPVSVSFHPSPPRFSVKIPITPHPPYALAVEGAFSTQAHRQLTATWRWAGGGARPSRLILPPRSGGRERCGRKHTSSSIVRGQIIRKNTQHPHPPPLGGGAGVVDASTHLPTGCGPPSPPPTHRQVAVALAVALAGDSRRPLLAPARTRAS